MVPELKAIKQTLKAVRIGFSWQTFTDTNNTDSQNKFFKNNQFWKWTEWIIIKLWTAWILINFNQHVKNKYMAMSLFYTWEDNVKQLNGILHSFLKFHSLPLLVHLSKLQLLLNPFTLISKTYLWLANKGDITRNMTQSEVIWLPCYNIVIVWSAWESCCRPWCTWVVLNIWVRTGWSSSSATPRPLPWCVTSSRWQWSPWTASSRRLRTNKYVSAKFFCWSHLLQSLQQHLETNIPNDQYTNIILHLN